ncbi:2-hydroxyacyl-CoA dehydratase [Campylobacter concisus]|uniref:2-hydroxyacyl-CoA dehydratase n=1 Tax=Campylobacter concisus TaxID=199 RepID=UPI003D1F198A
MAKHYLKIPCSVIYKNDAISDVIKKFVDEYKADDVIDIVLSGCHTYAIETNKIKEASKEASVSYMSLETDYSKQDVCWPDPHTFEGIFRISRTKHQILKGSKKSLC